MTIKKRLFWSNILMILVPVLMASLIGLLCVGFMWLALVHGIGIGIHDEEDFGVACAAISEMAEHESYEEGEDYVVLERLLDSTHMRLVVYSSQNSSVLGKDALKNKSLLGEKASSARMLYAHGEENASFWAPCKR